jgi:hypothetical protein
MVVRLTQGFSHCDHVCVVSKYAERHVTVVPVNWSNLVTKDSRLARPDEPAGIFGVRHWPRDAPAVMDAVTAGSVVVVPDAVVVVVVVPGAVVVVVVSSRVVAPGVRETEAAPTAPDEGTSAITDTTTSAERRAVIPARKSEPGIFFIDGVPYLERFLMTGPCGLKLGIRLD